APAERLAFTTSQAMEYFSRKYLTTRIGCPPAGWPLALVKELIDNGLDAAETKGKTPDINVTCGRDFFAVEDAGPGIEPEVVAATLDFSTKPSSNSKYGAPTRGQLGNARKCVVSAPAVLFPGEGAGVTITSQGIEHKIVIAKDELTQEPKI